MTAFFRCLALVLALVCLGAAAQERHITFIGSSSIAGWTQLQQDFPGARTINRGAGGSTLTDTIALVPALVAQKPDAVVIYAGDNDLWADRTPQRVLRDYRILLAKLHEYLPAARIVVISIKPSPARLSRKKRDITALNTLLAEEIGRDARMRFVNIFDKMVDYRGTPRRYFFQRDMLHLNRVGYTLWKQAVADALNDLLPGLRPGFPFLAQNAKAFRRDGASRPLGRVCVAEPFIPALVHRQRTKRPDGVSWHLNNRPRTIKGRF